VTREDTAYLLAVISAKYHGFDPEDRTVAVDAWQRQLKDVSLNDALKALSRLGDKYTVTPPDILTLIRGGGKP
jgi:hypothetical protein